MFGRKRVVQNAAVARRMAKFFAGLTNDDWRSGRERIARAYGEAMWHNKTQSLVDEKRLSRSRFYVGLSTRQGFEHLTKRAALVSDTLLLSHDWTGEYHELGVHRVTGKPMPEPYWTFPVERSDPAVRERLQDRRKEYAQRNNSTVMFGMHCPSLAELGRWIVDAKPLLTAGLAWYLPSYSLAKHETVDGERQRSVSTPEQIRAIDYLIRDGRAVDASGAEPIKSQLIRPILRTELPFLEGVDLSKFCRITVEEFASYSSFRDFLRHCYLELDESQNDTQSERELTKLGLRINDQVRAAHAEMEKARRKRAVSVTGAAIGTVTAALVAVYGPAFQSAIATLGASGGIWGIINASIDNNVRALREDKWYYAWALQTGN